LGLENLRTIFNRGAGNKFGTPRVNPKSEFNKGVPDEAVDYQNNRYGGFTLDSPKPFPEGFNIDFNQSGYTFSEGELGNSKFINIIKQNYGTLDSMHINAPFQPMNTTPLDEFSDTPQNKLNGPQISPISALLDGAELSLYSSDTQGAPESTFTNLGYNTTAYEPRLPKKVTDFKFGQNNIEFGAQNPYLGTEFDDNIVKKYVAGRENLTDRRALDVLRIDKFLKSQAGVNFINKQNELLKESRIITYTEPMKTNFFGRLVKKNKWIERSGKLVASQQRFGGQYDPDTTLGAVAGNMVTRFESNQTAKEDIFNNIPVPGFLGGGTVGQARASIKSFAQTLPFGLGNKFVDEGLISTPQKYTELVNDKIQFTFNPMPTGGGVLESFINNKNNIFSKTLRFFTGGEKDRSQLPIPQGDKMTITRPKDVGLKTETLGDAFDEGFSGWLGNVLLGDRFGDTEKSLTSKEIESEKHGMPFYFKDLRSNNFIVFRAYLEGLTEDVSPSWTSENYIGRSEPVYVYERAERSLNFTLKLYAQTPLELERIYEKLRHLTSLCYPAYANDNNLDKTRMVSPLTSLRIGELYGTRINQSKYFKKIMKYLTGGQVSFELAKGQLGFIKNLTYTVPESSTWETKRGKRVPKHIIANIGYQVIHEQVPDHQTEFYAYKGDPPYGFIDGLNDAVDSRIGSSVDNFMSKTKFLK
jgi:hypothetical protein